MITTSLGELLTIAEADLNRNQQAFVETAQKVDPAKAPTQVLADVQQDSPPASQLLTRTQSELDSLA